MKQSAPIDRRKEILAAATEVFAERGFHRTRVSDIAKKAGVAYGLIYHYFESKDDVLESIFQQNWGVFLKVLAQLRADTTQTASERLGAISDLLIEAIMMLPKTVQVIIQEVSRSDRFAQHGQLEAFRLALDHIEAIIAQGQQSGEFDSSVNPKVAAYAYVGACETTCTGVMLRNLACGNPDESEVIKHSLRRILLSGLRNVEIPENPG